MNGLVHPPSYDLRTQVVLLKSQGKNIGGPPKPGWRIDVVLAKGGEVSGKHQTQGKNAHFKVRDEGPW